MNKIIAAITVIFFAVLVSACGSSSHAAAPTSWNGAWTTHKSDMDVKITDNLIVIHLINDEDVALYWQGTWDNSAKFTDGTTIVSKADVEALDVALLGSLDKTKVFTYKNGQLSFKMSMMGMSTTIHLSKV